ncbi:MAG: minor capsid protein [Bradymonadia bacterium]|jgi:SPP1 gp7 family putative phage head morphogenesis protein
MAKKKLTEEEKAKLAEKKARMLKAQKEKAQKYWEDRAQARVLATDKSTQETERELLKAYQRAQQEIIQSVNDFYKRFAKDAQISGEQARELLTLKEYSNFKTEFHRKRMELKKLLSKDPRNIALRRYDKDFEKLSKLRKLTREETLLASIKHECIKLAAAQDKAMESGMAKSYGEAKDESRKDFAKAGLKTADKQSPETPVHKAIHEKWLGKDFSSRIWEDKNKLIEELRIILAQAFVIHEGIRNLSFRLATRLNVNINNAKRLIRTEFNHIANQASLDSYKRDGVKKYKFLAAIDSRTSDVCKSVNGQIFEVTKAKVGLNFPPMHPNCRSTTVAVFEDDDGRYDYIDVELNDEELAELGISREEYDAIRANNDEQAKAQASPLAISNKEAKAAEDATHSMEAKRKEEKRIENEAKAIIDAEKQEKERIDDLLFDIDYEAGWLDIWETLSQTPTTVSMQAERLETIQTKLDSCEDIVDKLEKRIEKIDPQTPPAPPKGKSAPEPTQELAKAKEKELAKAEEKPKPKNLPTRLRKIVDKARKTLTKLSGMLGKAKSRLSSLFERFKDKVKTVFGWDEWSGTDGLPAGATIVDPEGEDRKRAEEHAKTYYGLVRKMKTDVVRIANNTGYSYKDILRIKEHLFLKEHDLEEYGVRCFFPDFSIAQSWQRLIDGRDIKQHDLTLLKHELKERELMMQGMSQAEAHIEASKQFDYQLEKDKYYDDLKQYKKNR